MSRIKEIAKSAAVSTAIIAGSVGCADAATNHNAAPTVTQGPPSYAVSSDYNPVNDVMKETGQNIRQTHDDLAEGSLVVAALVFAGAGAVWYGTYLANKSRKH